MKNPVSSISPRATRSLYTMAALAVLLLTLIHALNIMVFKATSNDQCGWLVREKGLPGLLITQVVPGGVADQAGVRDGDVLLAINGQRFMYGKDAMVIINAIKRNDYAEYLIERNGTTFTTNVQVLKVFDINYLSNFLLGFGFLVVGYIVVMTRPQGVTQRIFGRFGILAMLFLGLSQFDLTGATPLAYYTYASAFVIAWIFALPTFPLFFLRFPVYRKVFDSVWLRGALYSFAVLTVIPNALRLFFGWNGMLPPYLSTIVSYTPVAFFIGGMVIFAVTYFTRVDPARRKQIRPILIGVLTVILAVVYANVMRAFNQFILFTTPVLLLPVLLIVLLPCALGYSIFKYRLMDIDLVVKRSLLYAVVTGMLAGLYLLLVYLFSSAMSYALGTDESQVGNLIAFVILAFAFDPLKRKAQDWIDRFFYQERYNYQRALLEFSQELPSKMHLDEILNSIISRISTTMHVEKVAVVLCDDQEGCSCASKNISEADCRFGREPDGLLAALRETRTPRSFALLATEPEYYAINASDKEKLARSGVVLSVPMYLQDRLIGALNVGTKMSGKVYSQEDFDLLSTVAGQAAIAVENARLHKSEIAKQRIEEELALARTIQQGLLPKANPALKGLEVSGVSIPAMTVGGDYFDYIELGPGKLLVVVGDVSGKGVSAALYMSKIQGMIQVIAPMYENPKEMLIQVNRRIYESLERRSFITMILALFDTQRKEVSICRAGHNRALIGVNGALEYLRGGGIGLGLERGPIFEQELEQITRPLLPNGIFVFYSDGLTEAMNGRKALFGEETVFDIVKAKRALTAEQIQHTILTSVEEFRGAEEQNDDLTVVVVKSTVGAALQADAA
ncbi:MAG: SpoIIE family protein phosphatase [Ignavibacteriales bacterium]|nr:SpoIIE family protein phosphatase [Ignavibacteriales bacterium]